MTCGVRYSGPFQVSRRGLGGLKRMGLGTHYGLNVESLTRRAFQPGGLRFLGCE